MFTSISSRVHPHARHIMVIAMNFKIFFLIELPRWRKMALKRWEMQIALTRMCQHDFVVDFNLMCVRVLKQQQKKNASAQMESISFAPWTNVPWPGCCGAACSVFSNSSMRESNSEHDTYSERWLQYNDFIGIAKRFGWNCMSWLWYQMMVAAQARPPVQCYGQMNKMHWTQNKQQHEHHYSGIECQSRMQLNCCHIVPMVHLNIYAGSFSTRNWEDSRTKETKAGVLYAYKFLLCFPFSRVNFSVKNPLERR